MSEDIAPSLVAVRNWNMGGPHLLESLLESQRMVALNMFIIFVPQCPGLWNEGLDHNCRHVFGVLCSGRETAFLCVFTRIGTRSRVIWAEFDFINLINSCAVRCNVLFIFKVFNNKV